MPLIALETHIKAPAERVFDLARSIDAHTASTGKTGEQAIAGRTSGLIEPGESVTWEARHLGVRQKLTSKITEFDRPNRFVDEMTRGAFASMRHEHQFESVEGMTVMRDEFQFSAPLGILGRIAEKMFLTRYMERFLRERNQVLTELAESGMWRSFLD